MRVSPRCLEPLQDAKGRHIQAGQTVELLPGTRPYRRLHRVEAHRAGFVKFVRDDGGYVYHAKKTRTGNYTSAGRWKPDRWVIV